MAKLTKEQQEVVNQEREAERTFQKSKPDPIPTPDQQHRIVEILNSDSSCKLEDIKKVLEEK